MPTSKDSVLIMTSVHPWDDPRIFYKEGVSLAKKFSVELHAVADFKTFTKSNLKVFGLPKYRQRFFRPLNWIRLFFRAWKSPAQVIHFHDPELIIVGLLLKCFAGKKVVYDVHEDFSASILTKSWIPRFIRSPLSAVMDYLEKRGCRFFDAVILAEFSYRKKFLGTAPLIETIVNYPLKEIGREIDSYPLKQLWRCGYRDSGSCGRELVLIYAGVISYSRGIQEIILSLAHVKEMGFSFRLFLVGSWISPRLQEEITELISLHNIQDRVLITGRIPLEEVYDLYRRADIGLALLHPEKNYLDSLATKMFEYMAGGLAVLASHFPTWKKLIKENRCGMVVDPLDVDAISRKIALFLKKRCLRCRLGNNGHEASRKRYNWDSQEEKLWALYDKIGGTT